MNDGRHVFVFGSNLAGRHGKGAALEARNKWGAVYGIGAGLTGHAYALPTKQESLRSLHMLQITYRVNEFLKFAEATPSLTFLVTPVGTGLAGYKHEQIAPLFKDAPANCVLPAEWKGLLC